VPLDLVIQKVGNQNISDIEKVVVRVAADTGLVEKRQVREPFATAQFKSGLDAAAKLSLPGYEKQVAGVDVSVSGTDTRTTHSVKRIVLHELITIDNNYKEHLQRFFNVGKNWFLQLLSSNATARSLLSQATLSAKVPFADKVAAVDPGFVIANTRDNTAWSGAPTFTSLAQAQDELNAQVQTNLAMRGTLHVIPAAEVKRAA
jgi:hypothetical protein